MRKGNFLGFLGGVFISLLSPVSAESTGDVISVSQCVYDVYVQLDDQKLRDIIVPLGISKGGYKRVDTDELKVLLQNMPTISKRHAGGAAANTLAGISSLGGKTTFIGIVGNDDFGQSFLNDMQQANVEMEYVVRKSSEGKGTALVILLITPDGERTIISYLGVSIPVEQSVVNPQSIKNHQILFSDAYVWDRNITSQMLHNTYADARKNGIVTSFGLGNASVVRMHRDQLIDFMPSVDIIFGNLSEYQALFDAESIETIIQNLQRIAKTAIVTNAEHGALIITPEVVLHTSAKSVNQVVDTTGAGDMFAAGFLYGITRGYDLEKCGKLGSEMAGHIITHVGARVTELSPEIKSLIEDEGESNKEKA
jgi:sugar/nucleoside kinase (ribokinase family)